MNRYEQADAMELDRVNFTEIAPSDIIGEAEANSSLETRSYTERSSLLPLFAAFFLFLFLWNSWTSAVDLVSSVSDLAHPRLLMNGLVLGICLSALFWIANMSTGAIASCKISIGISAWEIAEGTFDILIGPSTILRFCIYVSLLFLTYACILFIERSRAITILDSSVLTFM